MSDAIESLDPVVLRTWLAQSRDLLLLTDDAGRIRWANARFEQAFGVAPGGLLATLLAVVTSAPSHKAVQQALGGKLPNDIDLECRRADGSPLFMRANIARAGSDRLWTLRCRSTDELTKPQPAKPAASGSDDVQSGAASDISDRVAQRHRAEDLAQRLEAAARAANVGIWIATIGSTTMEWNAQMYELFDRIGKGPPPPPWKRWLARCVHRADRSRVGRIVAAFVRDGTAPLQIEFRSLRRDGSTRWIEMRGSLGQDAAGLQQLLGVAQDVTAHHRALAAFREASEHSSFIARAAGIGTWEFRYDGTTVRWDEQMFRLRGIEPPGTPLTRAERLALVHPDDLAKVLEAAEEENRQHTFAYEFRVRLPDGSLRWLASRSAPVTDPDTGTTWRVGVNWDITESRDAETARSRQLIAERESRARLAFMSRMSHELRTPLNAVLGFTQLLQIEAAGAGRAADLGKLKHIRNAGDHLLALIDDVLELTGLESGQLHLELQAVSVAETVAEAMRQVEPLAAQRQVRLATGTLEGHVHADPARLTQVLVKLLDNAIRYNLPRGDVKVEAHLAGHRLHLSVRDSGRGLPADQLAHLFEPFHRLGPRTGRIDRAGIGLTVVKALLHRMGGSIDVASQPGQGTSIDVNLPRSDESAPPKPARGTPSAQRTGRLLYIEDNSVNVMIVEQMVAALPGLSIVSEPTGTEGVARAQSLQPDLILVDINLPDFDGFEVLRRLRSEPETVGIPCIALTTNALAEDIARGLTAGFADYWTKPVDFKAFVAALERLFPLRGA